MSVETLVRSVPDDAWPVCGSNGCIALIPFSLHDPMGPSTTDDPVNALGPGEIDRWMVLRVPDGVLLVDAFAASRQDFRRFMPRVESVLRSVVVGS